MSVRNRDRIRVSRQVVTESPFETILYLNPNENYAIVEHKNQASQISLSDIRKYIRIDQKITEYELTPSGDIVRFNQGCIEGYCKINDTIELIPFTFNITSSMAKSMELHNWNTERFHTVTIEGIPYLECTLPMLPTYISYVRNTDRQLTMKEIFHCYKGQYFQFPYGNVSDNRLCAGVGNSTARTVRGLYINLINAPFNFDYFPVMSCRCEGSFINRDLDEIHQTLYSTEQSSYGISIWDIFHYLTCITDYENFDYSKIFKFCNPTYLEPIRGLLDEANAMG